MMDRKKEIYQYIWFFHGDLQFLSGIKRPPFYSEISYRHKGRNFKILGPSRQTDRQTVRHIQSHTYRQTARQADRQTDRQRDTQSCIQSCIQTDRQTDRGTDRHTYRQTDRQPDIHTYIPSHRHNVEEVEQKLQQQ